MIIVDAHCDTLMKLVDDKADLYNNNCHIDIKRMQSNGNYLQFFAAYVDQNIFKCVEMIRAIRLFDSIFQQAETYKEYISICKNHAEIIKAFNENKAAAILAIENGAALQGELSALRMFYKLGVRCISLTWNNRNEISDGLLEAESGGGLTKFGQDFISEMNRLGMIIDVSHSPEKVFWDVIERTNAPIIASHSCAKALCSHPRNLTDQQILAIKANGGVIGLNYYPSFLNDSGKASLDDVVKHIEHIAALSEFSIGLGSDFDGIDCTPEGLCGVEDVDKIFNRLLSLNYSESFIHNLAGGNFMRVIQEVVK